MVVAPMGLVVVGVAAVVWWRQWCWPAAVIAVAAAAAVAALVAAAVVAAVMVMVLVQLKGIFTEINNF